MYRQRELKADMELKPRTIASQLVLLVVGAILLSQVLIFGLFFTKTQGRIDEYEDHNVISSIIATYQAMQSSNEIGRQRLLKVSQGSDVGFFLTEKAASNYQIDIEKLDEKYFDELRELLTYQSDYNLTISEIWNFWFEEDSSSCFKDADPSDCSYRVFSLPLDEGTWLNVQLEPTPGTLFILLPVTASALLMLFVVILAVLVSARRITAPLRQLSDAAERLGRGEGVEELSVNGPEEISNTMKAFNVMQERLTRFVSDRTKMLAAISHDLRTPITSMRINCEFIKDYDLQQKLIRTLEDMQVMVESCLAFAKGEAKEEESKVIDLVATLDDIANDSSRITFSTSTPCYEYSCYAVNLKRAFRNVLENAVKYGKKAHMSFEHSEQELRINIQDQGSGIPEDQLEEVFEPFVRLDKARNTISGSVGLGLSIARTIIHRHGGTIVALNTNPGLKMVISLPVTQVSDYSRARQPSQLVRRTASRI
jgi:signal transduction histidine kinase